MVEPSEDVGYREVARKLSTVLLAFGLLRLVIFRLKLKCQAFGSKVWQMVGALRRGLWSSNLLIRSEVPMDESVRCFGYSAMFVSFFRTTILL